MAVAATANALLTLDEVRGAVLNPLAITGTEQDEMIQTLINRASDWVESYCNRFFVARAFTAMRLPGQYGCHLRPLATPIDVTQPITISLDGVAQTVWKTEADGDQTGKQVVVGSDMPGAPSYFYRASGWLGRAPLPILLSYTGGYAFASIPGDIKEAATLVVQTLHRHWKNLEPVQSMPSSGTGGVVTFRAEHLPMAAMYVLDRYRVWLV